MAKNPNKSNRKATGRSRDSKGRFTGKKNNKSK